MSAVKMGDLVYNKAYESIGIVVDTVDRVPGWPSNMACDFYEIFYDNNNTDFSIQTDLEVINETYQNRNKVR